MTTLRTVSPALTDLVVAIRRVIGLRADWALTAMTDGRLTDVR